MLTNGLRVIGEREELRKSSGLLASLTLRLCSLAAEKSRVGAKYYKLGFKQRSWRSLGHVCISASLDLSIECGLQTDSEVFRI